MIWWALIVLIVGVEGATEHGKNICQYEEKYNVTFQRTQLANFTIRDFIWCWAAVPRCSRYRTELRVVKNNVTEARSKKITRCCDGYKETATISNSTCIPICTKCYYGECVAPEHCTCHLGYTGMYCELKCQNDKWGRNCEQDCECKNRAACDAETGNCQCEPDWTGPLCETSIVQETTEINDDSTDCQNCDEKETNQMLEELEDPTDPSVIQLDSANEDHLVIVDTDLDLTDVTTDYSIKNFKPSNIIVPNRHYDTNERTISENVNNLQNFGTLSIGIATAIFLLFATIVVVFIMRYRNMKKMMKEGEVVDPGANDGGLECKSVVRSSFNAPLPADPVFHNPTFAPINIGNKVNPPEKPPSYQNFEVNNQSITYDVPPIEEARYYREIVDFQYDIPPPGSCRPVTDLNNFTEPLYAEILAYQPHLIVQRTKIQTTDLSEISKSSSTTT